MRLLIRLVFALIVVLPSSRAFCAIVQASSEGLSAFESGKTSMLITGGMVDSNDADTTHALNMQFSDNVSLFPAALSVSAAAKVAPGNSLTPSSTGDTISATAPQSNWGIPVTVTSCTYNGSQGDATLHALNYPADDGDCPMFSETYCGVSVATVSSGTACPTSAASYSFYQDIPGGYDYMFSPGNRVCFIMEYQAGGIIAPFPFDVTQQPRIPYGGVM